MQIPARRSRKSFSEIFLAAAARAFRLSIRSYANQKSLSALKFLRRGEKKQLREISVVSIRAL